MLVGVVRDGGDGCGVVTDGGDGCVLMTGGGDAGWGSDSWKWRV